MIMFMSKMFQVHLEQAISMCNSGSGNRTLRNSTASKRDRIKLPPLSLYKDNYGKIVLVQSKSTRWFYYGRVQCDD